MHRRPLCIALLLVFSFPLACNVESRAEPTRHWSLADASVMTPVLEDPVVELEPPGTPIYPNPGVMGCSSTFYCGCDEVQLFCGHSWVQRGCTITVPKADCHRLGIFKPAIEKPSAPDVVIDPECVLDPNVPPPVFDNVDTIMAYCGMQHESTHACDPSDAEVSCSERNAYGNSGICLSGFYDRQCANADPVPSYCGALALHVDVQDGFGALESCLCNGSQDCWACIDACTATGLAVQHCESYGFQSCGRDDIMVPDRPPPPVADVEPTMYE